ncbi:hypothetical protein ACH5RR_006645, partial [Cinchona calisaya]
MATSKHKEMKKTSDATAKSHASVILIEVHSPPPKVAVSKQSKTQEPKLADMFAVVKPKLDLLDEGSKACAHADRLE